MSKLRNIWEGFIHLGWRCLLTPHGQGKIKGVYNFNKSTCLRIYFLCIMLGGTEGDGILFDQRQGNCHINRQIVRSIFVEFFVLNGPFTKIGTHLFLTFETQKRKWWFENRTSTSYKGNRFLPFVFIAALLIYKSLHVRYFTVIRFSWDAWFYS